MLAGMASVESTSESEKMLSDNSNAVTINDQDCVDHVWCAFSDQHSCRRLFVAQ